MGKLLILICLLTTCLYSQSLHDNFIGKSEVFSIENGILEKKVILKPMPNDINVPINTVQNAHYSINAFNTTSLRWLFTDPAAIGDYCVTSGNGKYNVVGWNLNNERVSFHGNANAIPIRQENILRQEK